jgi:L-rhamnose mutarotase
VNLRWQKAMSAYFVPAEDLRDGERFPMMREVFYLA